MFVIFLLFQMIYLDFLYYFPDKLQEVTDLLVEKEHRVRIPLEELDLLLANKGNITSQIHDTNAENESTWGIYWRYKEKIVIQIMV